MIVEGKEVKVSQEDIEYLLQFKWTLDCKEYVARTCGPRKLERMHRVVAKKSGLTIDGLQVDHINRDKRDNRRENLRLATNGQNRANSKLNVDNKSGFRGVHKKKKRGQTVGRKKRSDAMGDQWVAQINHKSKKFHLGYFDTEEEAHEVYKQAARRMHGEFAAV